MSKVKDVVDLIVKQGDEVRNTYELKGHVISLNMLTTEDIARMYDIPDDFTRAFCKSIHTLEPIKIGPYDTNYYLHLVPAVKSCIEHLVLDSEATRRCGISFSEEHCFQSIQFLLRDNTVNVMCFMRSCDAVKNLKYDIWLCSYLADLFAYYSEKLLGKRPYDAHNIKMMFGSLHVYKEDI